MPGHANTFRSPRAIANMEKLTHAMTSSGMASVKDLALAVGLSPKTVAHYLVHMHDIGAAVRVCESSGSFKEAMPALWSAGKGSLLAEEADVSERQVVVRKQWEPNHQRNMMDWYLFGDRGMVAA